MLSSRHCNFLITVQREKRICKVTMMSYRNKYLSIVPYTVPHWASHLKNCPDKRVVLATLPTPLHRWNISGVPDSFKLFVKRDDMTGSSLSGNKVRKLEFLMADALSKGCKSVITCGGIQSNHCRATAIAAKELGLECHLLLRSEKWDTELSDVLASPGNLLPSVMTNCHLYFIPKASQYLPDIMPKQEILAENIRNETGHPAFPIPVGGSNTLGVFGYIQAWEEMIQEHNICEEFDDVMVACGSGGTIAGLAIGNYLTGQKVKLHSITVSDNKEYFYHHINEMLEEVGIDDTNAENIVDIIDGYKGLGYGKSTSEEREQYMNIASTSGILCDPVYTGKAIRGLLSELNKNPQRFKGHRVLFIHTGGVYSLYDGSMNSEIQQQFKMKKSFKWPNNSKMYETIY